MITTINPKATTKITKQRVIANKLTKEKKENHKKIFKYYKRRQKKKENENNSKNKKIQNETKK